MMPIDFLADEMTGIKPFPEMGPVDFLAEPEKEGIAESLALAPGRIGEDIVRSAFNLVKEIPGYYQTAKTEIPAAFHTLQKNPVVTNPFSIERSTAENLVNLGSNLHDLYGAGKQAMAGFAEMGQNIANLPSDIVNYLSSGRLNLVPENVNQFFQDKVRLPENTQQRINETYGMPGQPGEKLFRGMARNSLNTALLLTGANPAGLLATQKSIRNKVINTHDALERRASEGFREVSDEVKKRGINSIRLDPSQTGLIESLRTEKYFPNTRTANKLIDDAKNGDYNALRKIQSDLYTNGKKNKGSDLEADRLRGAEMFEKRDEINNIISDHLHKTGNDDLNKILNTARDDYRILQNTYYNENMSNAIVNMVNSDYRKIPRNIVNILNEESKPMQALKDFHPGLENEISKYGARQNVFSALKKYAVPPALVGAGVYGGAKYVSGNRNQ